MSWRKLIPRYRVNIVDGGRASSFRWLGIKWDSLRSPKGFWFAQYGRKPATFVCRAKRTPFFLYGHSWKVAHQIGNLKIGTTKTPLDFSWVGGEDAART